MLLFIMIAVGCGWLGKLVDMILVDQPEGQSLGSLIWLISPFIASVLLAVVHKSDYKALGLKPRLKGNGKWYLVSMVTFPGILLLSIGIGIITGSIDTSRFELQGFFVTILSWFIYNFFRTILEELAWRGFLQERLMLCKVKDWTIYFITAAVWSLWHIPYYLFFFEGNAIKLILSGFVILFSWSILFTEIYRITGSIWPCVLLHATSNAIQYTMLENYLVINPEREYIISPTGSIMACVIVIVLGLMLRGYRIKRMNI
jgi:membrane protease YdiL (CAAX protease family)